MLFDLGIDFEKRRSMAFITISSNHSFSYVVACKGYPKDESCRESECECQGREKSQRMRRRFFERTTGLTSLSLLESIPRSRF